MSRSKKIIYFFLTSILLCGSFFVCNKEQIIRQSSIFCVAFANSEEVKHLVISEIQISGESVYDEFIELYNPTDLEIDINGWDLKRKTESGSESNVLNNIEGVISANGYFLVIPRANCGDNNNESCYKKMVSGDDEYTTNSFFANNNTVLLYNCDGVLIDKVGWGRAIDFESEVINLDLENSKSLERKIIDNIIQDTDNNEGDFILRDDPEPQNSGDTNDQDDENSDEQKNSDDENDNNNEEETEDDNNGSDEQDSPMALRDIVITEFLPNPEDSDRDNEFIEIYNNDDTKVDLSGWVLEDKIGSAKKFVISNNTEINIGEYKVFYSDETKITLNNSGDGVILKDNKNNIIDETPVSDSVQEEQSYVLDEYEDWVLTLKPTPGRKNVIKVEENNTNEEQKNFGQERDINKKTELNLFSDGYDNAQDGSTQEYEANNEDSYDYSDRIVISEVYPNPFGRDNRKGNYEWVELYNNSSEDVNLKGWRIDDILKKGSRAYIIKEDKIIQARSFAVFENVQTKIMFNNSGDEVNVLWPDGEVVDNLRYEKADEGVSYNWTPNSWKWSSEITPGKNNKAETIVIRKEADRNNLEEGSILGVKDAEDKLDKIEDIEPDYIEANIKDIKHFTKYSRVKVSGIVSTPPGIFADNTFYLLGSGIQVYSYEVKIPKIELGDKIEIIGRVSEVGGEKRILLDNKENIKVVGHNNLVVSKLILTGDINESTEGYLAMIEGKVSQIKEDVFFLDDGSGEIKIYIKPQTNIKKPEIKIGDWMVIVGQVSQTSSGYRILPRFQGDIKLSQVSGITEASQVFSDQRVLEENKNNNFLLYGIISIIGLVVLIDWIRIRIKKKKNNQRSLV